MDDGAQLLYDRGRRAWPKIELGAASFARALAEHGAPADAHVEDFYLACACAEGDAAALAAFDELHLRQVGRFVARVDASPEFAAEVRQDLRERLLVAEPGGRPRIGGYSGQGPLGAWVRVAAVRVALDLTRRRKDGAATPELSETVAASTHDPEVALVKARYREVFEEALEAALARLSPKEKNLLRMSLVDGLSIDRIGVVYRAHRATAARWIAAVRQKLLDELYQELHQRLQLSPEEFASLTADVQSQLHVSVVRLLGSA
jgi:RNA polymerase sigma-70 factor (ECF subfamily)